MSQNPNSITNGNNSTSNSYITSNNTNLSLFFQNNNNSNDHHPSPSSLYGLNSSNNVVGNSNNDIYSPTSPSFPTTPSWCNSTSSISNAVLNTNINNNNNNNNGQYLSTPTSSGVIYQSLKRKNNSTVVPLDERVTLEYVFVLTVSSNTRLSQSCDGIIAYLAGCVIVLYDPYTQKQDFLISQARKTLTTVAFSPDGRILATGEVKIAYIFLTKISL